MVIGGILQYQHNIFNTLILTFFFVCIVWYIQYLWTKRRFYLAAAKRPGPFPLPLIGNNLMFMGSNRVKLYHMERLTNTYDNPVRVWLDRYLMFLTQDLKDAETICNSPNALNRGNFFRFLRRTIGFGLFTAPYQRWKRTRKVITPTFNIKILDGFVPIFYERSTVLAEKLESHVGKGLFDIQERMSLCILDIFCETAIGVKMNLQVEPNDFVDWVHKTLEIAITRVFSVWYQWDFVFNLSKLGREFDKAAREIFNFVDNVIKDKKAVYHKIQEDNKNRPEAALDEVTKRNSFLEQLVELSETGAHFSDVDLRHEVVTLLGAGTDTSTLFNSFVLLMLGMYPEIQDQVYQEIMDVIGPDRPVEASDLGKLQLLDRVMKETLRLFPIAPYVVRESYGDIQLEKVLVPAGCILLVAVYNIHRNPKIYPDPYKFDPNRFLPEEVAKRSPYTWMPFGMGLRNCVGMRYALHSSKVLLAVLLRKYKFHSEWENVKDMKLQADVTLQKVDGYKVSIEYRE